VVIELGGGGIGVTDVTLNVFEAGAVIEGTASRNCRDKLRSELLSSDIENSGALGSFMGLFERSEIGFTVRPR
jgi:hypothetical protein